MSPIVIHFHFGPWNHRMESEPQTAAEWKNLGNKQFVLKRFTAAIKAYTTGLSLSNYEDLDLLANRAAAYINLGNYSLALADVDSVLKSDPSHTKAIYRKARTLLGLSRPQEAVKFLKREISKQKKPNKDLLTLMEKSETNYQQHKTGVYNVQDYLYKPFEPVEEWVEYYRPVEVKPIPGKGRGLVATENLSEGQLTLACRAYAMVFMEPNKKEALPEDNVMSHYQVSTLHDLSGRWLVQKIYDKIKSYPESARDFYQLYAGEGLGSVDPSTMTDASTLKPDIERISGICRHNSFANSGDSFPEVEKSVGVFLLPSYCNHLCVGGNCTWKIYGNFIFVRTYHSIPKGEELIISYASPTWPYKMRNELLIDRLGFVCTCTLCTLDRELSVDVITQREKLHQLILKQEVDFMALSTNSNTAEMYKRFQTSSTLLHEIIKKIEEMHPKHGLLNVLTVDAWQKLGMKYFGVGQFEKAAECMQKAHSIMKALNLPHGAVECMLWVVGSHLQMQNTKMAKYWIHVLKKDAVLAHGTVKVLKLMGDWVLKAMEEQNVKL